VGACLYLFSCRDIPITVPLRPQPGQLSTYTDALDRLNVNFAFAADRMPQDAVCLPYIVMQVIFLMSHTGASGGNSSQEAHTVVH
jgi:hypothetical protein